MEKVEFIEEYVNTRLENGQMGHQVAELLGVSVSMVSSYKRGDYNPSLNVAKHVYQNEGIVFHPFSKDALVLEIAKDKK